MSPGTLSIVREEAGAAGAVPAEWRLRDHLQLALKRRHEAGRRRPEQRGQGRARFAVDQPAKILVEGIQGIGLELSEGSSQLLFYLIDRVEESTSVDLHLAAAKLPIRAQQEMEAEHLVFEFVQKTAADEAEIGGEVFALSGIRAPTVPPPAELQGDRAGGGSLGDIVPKAVVTGAKDSPKHAVAGYFSGLVHDPHALTVALKARGF